MTSGGEKNGSKPVDGDGHATHLSGLNVICYMSYGHDEGAARALMKLGGRMYLVRHATTGDPSE